MNKHLLIALCTAVLPTLSMADPAGKPTVTVDGQATNKTVTELTFDGDNVILHYDDNTTGKADMNAVTVTWSTPTNITAITKKSQRHNTEKIYDLKGRYVGRDARKLPRGVYIVNGKKTIEQPSSH